MKRRISTIMVLATISTIGLTSLNACAATTNTTATATATEEAQAPVEGEKPMENRGVMAKVTAVDGNSVTIQESQQGGRGGKGMQGEMPNGEMPELPEGVTEGEVPAMPEDAPADAPTKPEGTEKMTGERPELPDNATEGEKTEKHEREENGEMPEMTFDGEAKTITVDESILFTENENREKVQASLSDITVDTVLSIVYDEDGVTPTEITIRK